MHGPRQVGPQVMLDVRPSRDRAPHDVAATIHPHWTTQMQKPSRALVASFAFGVVATAAAIPFYVSRHAITDLLAAPAMFTYRLIQGGDLVEIHDLLISFAGGCCIWATFAYLVFSALRARRHATRLVAQQPAARSVGVPTRGRAVASAWLVLAGLTLLATVGFNGLAGPVWVPLLRGVLAVLVLRGSRIALLLLAGELTVSALIAFLPLLHGYTVMDNDPIWDPIFYLIGATVLISCWKDLPLRTTADWRLDSWLQR